MTLEAMIFLSRDPIALSCWYWLVLIGSLCLEINSSLVVYADDVIFAFSNWPELVVDTSTKEYQGRNAIRYQL